MALSLIFNGLRNPDYLWAFQIPGMWNKDTWLAMVYPSHGEALFSSFTFLRDHFVCDQLLFRFLTSRLLFQEYIFFQGVSLYLIHVYIDLLQCHGGSPCTVYQSSVACCFASFHISLSKDWKSYHYYRTFKFYLDFISPEIGWFIDKYLTPCYII